MMKTPPNRPTRTPHTLAALILTSGLLSLTQPAHCQEHPSPPDSTLNSPNIQKPSRDWEKYPPITDSEVIAYEREHNVPIEERFETLERKAMSSWYENEAIRRVLQLSAPTVKKQRSLLKKALQKLKTEDMSSYERDQLIEYTQQLFADTFPEAIDNAPPTTNTR